MFLGGLIILCLTPPLFHHPFHLLSFSHTQTTITFPLVTKNLLCLFCSVGFVISVGVGYRRFGWGGQSNGSGRFKKQNKDTQNGARGFLLLLLLLYQLMFSSSSSSTTYTTTIAIPFFRTKGVLTWRPGRRHLLSLAVLSYHPYHYHYYGVGCATGKRKY